MVVIFFTLLIIIFLRDFVHSIYTCQGYKHKTAGIRKAYYKMKTVGIIAEYNPFHNGHLYQLTQAKALSGADYAVVVLSGDFTQRGTPALLNKYARCEMALLGGADLVIELPVCYATGSAEYFAKGAVGILDGLGVDALCFGSECGDVDALKQIARILSDEPEHFKQLLQENLKQGMSFPTARNAALRTYLTSCKATALSPFGEPKDEYTAAPHKEAVITNLLQAPNNILGVEYLKALYKRNSSMEVYTVTRKGADYGDNALSAHSFSSALAIRECIFAGREFSALAGSMPPYALDILKRELSAGYPAANGYFVSMEDFSSMLFYRLLSLQAEGYTAYADITKALSDKISASLDTYCSVTNFAENKLKSKDLTRSRIDRSLLHILLNIQKADFTAYAACGDVFYARILGFRKTAEPLFRHIKNTSTLPLLSKLANAEATLKAAYEACPDSADSISAAQLADATSLPTSSVPTGKPKQTADSPSLHAARRMLQQDIFAAHLYEGVVAQKSGSSMQNEYRRQIVMKP